MLKKNDFKEIIKVGIILFLITAISAGLLAYVNSFTSPIIAENDAKKQAEAMKVVLPSATDFSDAIYSEDFPLEVTAVYEAINGAGHVVMVSPNGYGGAISLVVGISYSDAVTGVSVISQSETPGLGAKCTNEEFLSQFVGKHEGLRVVKQNPLDNEVNAISSATITSKAVTLGVNSAISAVKMIKEGK